MFRTLTISPNGEIFAKRKRITRFPLPNQPLQPTSIGRVCCGNYLVLNDRIAVVESINSADHTINGLDSGSYHDLPINHHTLYLLGFQLQSKSVCDVQHSYWVLPIDQRHILVEFVDGYGMQVFISSDDIDFEEVHLTDVESVGDLQNEILAITEQSLEFQYTD